jgi:hypothetical protein
VARIHSGRDLEVIRVSDLLGRDIGHDLTLAFTCMIFDRRVTGGLILSTNDLGI